MPSNQHSPADLELLRLHIEAGWGIHLPPLAAGNIQLRDKSVPAEWSAYLAVIGGEEVSLWHPRVQPMDYERLAVRMRAALAVSVEVTLPGVEREVSLAHHEPARPVPKATQRLVRVLSPADAPLMEAFEAESAPYFTDSRRAPAIGVELDGRLLTIAHSSRRTAEACELGINTLPEARRRGYALAATIRWAETVVAEGLMPFYSARASNVASLALAHAAGFRPFVRAAYLMATES